MPAAPPAPAGPPAGGSGPRAAARSRRRPEQEETLVATFCSAALAEPGAAVAAAGDALDHLRGATGDMPTDPAHRWPTVQVLGAAWRACLRRTESSSDTGPGGGRAGAPDAGPPQTAAIGGSSPDLGGQVRAAAGTLPPPERAALVLGGWFKLGSDEVAEVLGLPDGAQADLLVGRARLTLSAALRREEPPVLDDDPPSCRRALGLMVRRRDVGLGRREDRGWLDAHLDECSRCPRRRQAIGEAALAWRVWTPPEPGGGVVVEPGGGVVVEGGAPPVPARADLPAAPRAPDPPTAGTGKLHREISRRAGVALVGAVLIAAGALLLAPGSGRPRRPPAPRPARVRVRHHRRPGFTSAPVRLPPAPAHR